MTVFFNARSLCNVKKENLFLNHRPFSAFDSDDISKRKEDEKYLHFFFFFIHAREIEKKHFRIDTITLLEC